MPFLLCSAKPTEHLFICVMVSTAADPSPDYGKLTQQTPPIMLPSVSKRMECRFGVSTSVPLDLQSSALPIELKRRLLGRTKHGNLNCFLCTDLTFSLMLLEAPGEFHDRHLASRSAQAFAR